MQRAGDLSFFECFFNQADVSGVVLYQENLTAVGRKSVG
jgi:hypothetical protein